MKKLKLLKQKREERNNLRNRLPNTQELFEQFIETALAGRRFTVQAMGDNGFISPQNFHLNFFEIITHQQAENFWRYLNSKSSANPFSTDSNLEFQNLEKAVLYGIFAKKIATLEAEIQQLESELKEVVNEPNVDLLIKELGLLEISESETTETVGSAPLAE